MKLSSKIGIALILYTICYYILIMSYSSIYLMENSLLQKIMTENSDTADILSMIITIILGVTPALLCFRLFLGKEYYKIYNYTSAENTEGIENIEKEEINFFKTKLNFSFKPKDIFKFFVVLYFVMYLSNTVVAFVCENFNIKTPEAPEFLGETSQTFLKCIFPILIAPFIEELVYRFILFRPFQRYGNTAAVLVTALMFGIMHGNLFQFFYAFVGGIVLGIAMVKFNSLTFCVFIHMINNTFDVVFREIIKLDSLGIVATWVFLIIIISGLVFSILGLSKAHLLPKSGMGNRKLFRNGFFILGTVIYLSFYAYFIYFPKTSNNENDTLQEETSQEIIYYENI